MAKLIDNEMLHAFAVSGTVEQLAQKLVTCCAHEIDRISPVIYQPDAELLGKLARAINAACARRD